MTNFHVLVHASLLSSRESNSVKLDCNSQVSANWDTFADARSASYISGWRHWQSRPSDAPGKTKAEVCEHEATGKCFTYKIHASCSRSFLWYLYKYYTIKFVSKLV